MHYLPFPYCWVKHQCCPLVSPSPVPKALGSRPGRSIKIPSGSQHNPVSIEHTGGQDWCRGGLGQRWPVPWLSQRRAGRCLVWPGAVGMT